MKDLTNFSKLQELIGLCVINDITFNHGPTVFRIQDAFNGIIKLSTLKLVANNINKQLKSLDTDDLFNKGKSTNENKILTLKRDVLVEVVSYIETELEIAKRASIEKIKNKERTDMLKRIIADKEIQNLTNTDIEKLKDELLQLESEV